MNLKQLAESIKMEKPKMRKSLRGDIIDYCVQQQADITSKKVSTAFHISLAKAAKHLTEISKTGVIELDDRILPPHGGGVQKVWKVKN